MEDAMPPTTTSGPAAQDGSPQADVLALLADPRTYGPEVTDVACIETHGALVFLAGASAYKIKRAVKFSYMDFSTLALREAACRRELEVNTIYAPDLYLGLVPIVRLAGGRLALGGAEAGNDGEPVEWAVHMRRFEQGDLLGARAKQGALDPALVKALADAVFAAHGAAPRSDDVRAAERIGHTAREVAETLVAAGDVVGGDEAQRYQTMAAEALRRLAGLLDHRAAEGYVRRCHGDMHLNNVVVLDGRPVLFDAIEFSEEIATIDVLYDLAFLLMDLWRENQKPAANLLLNRYLWRDGSVEAIAGLEALPYFMALRAAVRSMVNADRHAQSGDEATAERARDYLHFAIGLLEASPPRLVAVGGFSGTGKTTLATGLAPAIGDIPGAVHLRSDLERKSMFGVEETDRLPAEAYRGDMHFAVYERLIEKAEVSLRAGRCVVLDAVFGRSEERAEAEAVAARCGVPFDGVWLTAPGDVLVGRVARRVGDASDATPDVVRQQLAQDPGPITWHEVDSGNGPQVALRLATEALCLSSPSS